MHLKNIGNTPIVRRCQGSNEYVSSCSICKTGIFTEDEREWIRRPHLVGLVHTECAKAGMS